MIDIKDVIKRPAEMKENIRLRAMRADVDHVIALYNQTVALQQTMEKLQHQANQFNGPLEADKERGRALRVQIAEARQSYNDSVVLYNEQVLTLPNWMSPAVPTGTDDAENKEVAQFLPPTVFTFKPRDHLQLGAELDILDFEAGSKVAGSKFYFLKNEAVLLQHAIKSFAFRKAMERGFTPLHTPDMAKNSVLQGAGFAPRGEESNTYEIKDTDLSLVATAEIAVGGMHADEILNANRLPLLYVAESHCFRKESGAAGRASKGLYRVHQFEKIELFAFTTPEQSEETHKMIRELEESIYQDLQIPYRVVLNCAGDLGAPAYKKYDIEAWMPGKGDNGEYGEVTSASNCTTYQARRLNIRYKNPATGRNEYVHTLNGTAVALSRTPVAILENYQLADGSVKMPEVLVPYLGFDTIRRKSSQAPKHL